MFLNNYAVQELLAALVHRMESKVLESPLMGFVFFNFRLREVQLCFCLMRAGGLHGLVESFCFYRETDSHT
jgi:hypothetical protein